LNSRNSGQASAVRWGWSPNADDGRPRREVFMLKVVIKKRKSSLPSNNTHNNKSEIKKHIFERILKISREK
jgi:hypothetical protein